LRDVIAININAPLGAPIIINVEYGRSCVANAIVSAMVAAQRASTPRRRASRYRSAGISAAKRPTVNSVQTYADTVSASVFCGAPNIA